ncbi:glycosyltransferase family 25 protein [Guyparkeria sp. 1SP6A2]|nr:glycosyltransferase family 25 protein [Guyparkeria sp. 1SP6A2]
MHSPDAPEQKDVLILCISLPEASARRAFMRAQLDPLPVTSEIVDAVRGVDLELGVAMAQGYRPNAIAGVGELTANEIACVLSHKKALQRFLASEQQVLVVFEDDAELGEGFMEVLQELLPMTPCVDAVKLENRSNQVSLVLQQLGQGHCLHVPERPGLGATAVLYTRRGALRVLRSLETFSVGYDTHLGRLWREGIRLLQVSPAVVSERENLASTIGHASSDGQCGRKKMARRWDRLKGSVGRRVYRLWLFVLTKRCLNKHHIF